MKENEVKRSDDIRVNPEDVSFRGSTVALPDGKLEFLFEEEEKRGLVFEDDAVEAVSPVTETETETESLSIEEPIPELDLRDEPSPARIIPDISFVQELDPIFDDPSPSCTEEISEPISDSGDLSSTPRTYMPRFTEVSDTYRMNNDPRPRPAQDEAPKDKITVESASPDSSDKLSEFDPTAETLEDNAVSDAVVVNINQKAPEVEEQVFSIYKFSDSKADPEPVKEERERTVEDEIAEIEELIVRSEEPEIEPEIEPEREDAEPTVDEDEPPQENVSYTIPDPDSRVHIVDYTSVAAKKESDFDDSPEGVDNSTGDSAKTRRKTEFVSPSDRDFFKDKFLDSIMSTKIRLVAAVILTLATFIFENVGVFGLRLDSFLIDVNFMGATALVDLQFAICVFLLAIPEISRAFRALGRKIAVPELLPTVSLILLSLYTLFIIFVAPPMRYPLFGTVCAVHSLAAIISTVFKRGADFLAFKRLSASGVKHVLDRRMTRTLERENLALDGAVDETKSETSRIFKTSFVSGFFKNSSSTVENPLGVIVSLSVSLSAAIIGFVIAFFVGNGWIDAVTVFIAVSLLTLPAISVILHKLAFYHSSLECDAEDSAIIGEGSIYAYSGVDVIAFDDTDVFGIEDVNLKRIIHYGDVDNVMKAMRQMSALFANFGGPLSRIFENSLEHKCLPAQNPEIESDGIAGMVEGHLVRAGSAEYMRRYGIEIPDSAASAYAGASDSTKVMYGAEDGVVYVQFHIRYSFSEAFTMILPELKERKVVPLIYTRDPNVSLDLISALTGGEDSIRILRKNTVKPTEDKVYPRINAGIVTSGSEINAMNVILLAKKYVRLMKKFSVLELVAMGTGCALAAVLAITGHLWLSSMLFLGWHLAWFAVFYIISNNSFAVKKKEENIDDR